MEIESSYVKEVAQVSKTNGVSTQSTTEEKPTVDYSQYSVSDIRDIPYDEAKENYDEINERLNDLSKNNTGEYETNQRGAAYMQLSSVQFSSNDKLNEARYDAMSSMESPAQVISFSAELQTNLQDYYYGKDTTARFQINGTDGSNHVHKELNASQLSNINMDAFIDKMLTTFTKDYENAKDPSIKEQYKEIVDAYSSFKSNYDEAVTTPYYA